MSLASKFCSSGDVVLFIDHRYIVGATCNGVEFRLSALQDESGNLTRLGILAVIDVLSWLTITILTEFKSKIKLQSSSR
jgi:hypothetical protein